MKTSEKIQKKAKVQETNNKSDDSCLLFVKNLPEDVTNEQLSEHFPESVSCRVARGPGGAFKGFLSFHFKLIIYTYTIFYFIIYTYN